MSIQKNKEFIRRYLEDVSGKPKPEELLRKYITDETLIEHILTSEAAFPMYKIEVEEMITEGDLVSVRGLMSGTHLGPFMGIPGTGKSFCLPSFVTYRVVAGKIVDHWMKIDEADVTDLLGQLGITQAQPPGSG
jgi:predicted ester cyclase